MFSLSKFFFSRYHSMFKLLCSLVLLTSGVANACNQFDAGKSDFPSSLTQTTAPSQSGIVSAWYDGATDRYDHGVLGDTIEPSILIVNDADQCSHTVELDNDHVFEDIETRLADIDNHPGNEVITIRSHQNKGAQIAVYKYTAEKGLHLLDTTPYIGTANRWLAPVGIADFNQDGNVDIAFVDRPHLAKLLRVWSYRDGRLTETANQSGYSNHQIGEDFISGGVRHCGDTVSMITADAGWKKVLETHLHDGKLVSKELGPFENTNSLTSALQCDPG